VEKNMILISNALENLQSSELICSNSSISNYNLCNRLYLYNNILRLKSPVEKPALTFGSAIHAALRAYYSHKPIDQCLFAFVEEAQKISSQIQTYKEEGKEELSRSEYSVQFGFELLKKYFASHSLDNEYFDTILKANGKYCVEQGFCLELPNGLVVGKIDLLGTKRTSSRNIVVEHKSTSRYLNDKYFIEFNPNLQIELYLIAASVFLQSTPECVLVNALFVKDYKREAKNGSNDDKLFSRIETSRTESELEQTLEGVNFKLGQIQDSINTCNIFGFPKNAPYACYGKYGACQFTPLCKCKDENLINILMNTSYEKREFGVNDVFDESEGTRAEEITRIDAFKKEIKDIVDVDKFVEDVKNKIGD
jgi:hypothetical protein